MADHFQFDYLFAGGGPMPQTSHSFKYCDRMTDALTLTVALGAGEPYKVLDLRSAGDFASAHIPGARWLSRGRLDLQIEQEVPDKNTPVVLYCRKGNESMLSTPPLKALGYQQVFVLQGGFAAWKDAGLPTEQGLGTQGEFEELAVAEAGLLGSGSYGHSNERMAKYLKDEEELGTKYRRGARSARG